MKGRTEIKMTQYLKSWYSFRIFRIVWDRLVLDPSWLKSIPIPLKKKTGADSDSVPSRALLCGIHSDRDSG